MAIKLTSIGTSKSIVDSTNKQYLYKDISLDLSSNVYFNTPIAKSHQLNDVQAIYDIVAIKNSIANIFLTSPGQKVLNPEFGLDLRRFLFDPITDANAFFIYNDITRNLPYLEPRIVLKNVDVRADIDNQEYNITLQIDVPQLNVIGVSISGNLNSNGYTII